MSKNRILLSLFSFTILFLKISIFLQIILLLSKLPRYYYCIYQLVLENAWNLAALGDHHWRKSYESVHTHNSNMACAM